VSRREDVVVFLVEVVLVVDFEEGFNAFLVTGSALDLAFVVVAFAFVAVFAGLAVTLGSLTSFFTAVFFVSLDSLVVVPFLVVDFFAVEDLADLAVVVAGLDLVVDFAGVFLVVAGLDARAGLFWPRH